MSFIAKLFVIFIPLYLSISACKDKQIDEANVITPAKLTQKEAELRKQQVANTEYTLFFDLTKNQESFYGKNVIKFDYSGQGETLMIDFHKGKILNITLNNQSIKYHYDGNQITIKTIHLNPGKNRIDIEYEHEYSKTGYGLYRFLDPVDQQVYFYTNSEPFAANYFFPCFDQPNLKASYRLEVIADSAWHVISSTKETKVTPIENEKNHWVFPTSSIFSTYLFSLHAGDYKVFEDANFRYPLKLYVRKSVAKYVDALNWFEMTRFGLDFYEGFFGVRYPYQKYDQLLVPDLAQGAMENVGAVTFNEMFISRGKETRAFFIGRYMTILHEMAHMWFGNLVTMNWWNDLWLNESFADFMAAFALEHDKSYKQDVRAFGFARKAWAYWADQLPTTHPIQSEVEDTLVARTIFDGISYGKGAAVLKQLYFIIGEDAFRSGIKSYFTQYAEKNTTLDNYLKHLSEAAKIDLKAWSEQWLKTAGVNRLIVDCLCEDDKITSLTFHQKASLSHPTLRQHEFLIGSIEPQGQASTILSPKKIKVHGAVTNIEDAEGLACFDGIFPNYLNYGYFKVKLGKKTLEYCLQNLDKINQPLARLQLWHTFWEMLRDQHLSLEQMVQLGLNMLANEQNPLVVRIILNWFTGVYGRGSLIEYTKEKGPKEYEQLSKNLFTLLWQQLKTAPANSDNQYYYFNALTKLISSPEYANQLVTLLGDKHPIADFNVDQDMRWGLIVGLSEAGYPKAKTLIDNEKQRDKSQRGHKSALAAMAALPNKQLKQQLLEDAIKRDTPYSLSEIKAIFNHLFPLQQSSARTEFQETFFLLLTQFINEKRDNAFLGAFLSLAPKDCQHHTLSEQYLIARTNLPPVVTKGLLINQYENEKCALIAR
jgi:aminopeptidase N